MLFVPVVFRGVDNMRFYPKYYQVKKLKLKCSNCDCKDVCTKSCTTYGYCYVALITKK